MSQLFTSDGQNVEGRAFGRGLGREGGAPMNRIGCLFLFSGGTVTSSEPGGKPQLHAQPGTQTRYGNHVPAPAPAAREANLPGPACARRGCGSEEDGTVTAEAPGGIPLGIMDGGALSRSLPIWDALCCVKGSQE